MTLEEFRTEIDRRERFEFGENWKSFLKNLSKAQIKYAEESLCEMLGFDDLTGKNFLDIGSGSGLSSLAARNKGAKVTSFDFDETSVWCTAELKKRFFKDDEDWVVEQGSVLDRDFLVSFGGQDIVYSWGVLHHTGRMWSAIDNSLTCVKSNGVFFIAVYNDQGFKSHAWWLVKSFYNNLPKFLKKPFAYTMGSSLQLVTILKYTIKLEPMTVVRPMLNYKKSRGMSMFTDVVDWYGGFPFEFAKYNYLVDYIENKGFKLIKGKEYASLGCHELSFLKH